MRNDVRIVRNDAEGGYPHSDFVRVRTASAPFDSTITLATIERIVARPSAAQESPWHVKTLVDETPMSLDAAVGLAACYAKRKHISIVYTEIGPTERS